MTTSFLSIMLVSLTPCISHFEDDKKLLLVDLLQKWEVNIAKCANLSVTGEITSTGTEQYSLKYSLQSRNHEWDAITTSKEIGSGRMLSDKTKVYFISSGMLQGRHFAKVGAREGYDFIHRRLWHYCFASFLDGKGTPTSAYEYLRDAAISSKEEMEVDGRTCVRFLLTDRFKHPLAIYFSKKEDYAFCRLDYTGVFKSSQTVKSWMVLKDGIRIPKEVYWFREIQNMKVEVTARFSDIEINPKYRNDFLVLRFPENCALFSDIDNSCSLVDTTGKILGPCTTPQGNVITYTGKSQAVEAPTEQSFAWLYYLAPAVLILCIILWIVRKRRRSQGDAG